MDDEEEIPVKYKLDGETEWQVKKEAVMKLGKTEWAIRLKLCKQGENHSYYSLHVAALTPNQVSRLQIKCTHQVEPPVVDWEQEYTFGGAHTVLVNPCLLKIAEQKEKMTFVVELKLLNDSEKKPEKPFECEKEINFPGGDFILKSGNRKLKINSAYVKRRCPLLGYLFENEETKEYDVGDVEFEDLVDIFGIFQNRWELEADRNLLLLTLLVSFVLAIIPNHYHFKKHLKRGSRKYGNSETAMTTGYMAQNLDHLIGNASGTFTQRYLYSQQYTLHQRTAFLYVSGVEGPNVVLDDRTPIVKTAKQFGATIFTLEHRYYGESKPNVDKLDAYNLRHLNSFQATQDVISFIKYANVQFNMDQDVRWVVWGIGYGGIIAAEARKLDPNSVSGVIASSTPLTHEYDFWRFNHRVAIVLAETGGSLCYRKVANGFADIREAMKTPEGRLNISDLFQLNPRLNETALNYNDIQMFYLAIIAPFQEIVEFNDDFDLSIADLCTTIDKSNWTNMEVVYQAYVYLSTTLDGFAGPMDISYQDFVDSLGDQSVDSGWIDNRIWQYQVCTEFGWFYTTNDNEQGLFGPVVPASLFLNQCFDIFPDANLTATGLRDSIINYNNFYGSSYDYSGTNAVFTNGMNDPWRELGKTSTGDFSVVAYLIPDASTASDMFPGNTNNSFIIQAHNLMTENINVWLNGPRNPKTFVNTTVPWTRPYWGEYGSLRETMLKQEVESKFSKLENGRTSEKTFPEPKFKKVFLGRPPHGFLPESDFNMSPDDYPAGFETGSFRQRQDHFNNQNADFFQQRFFKNTQWAKPGGPNFLMIGGEGPDKASWVLNENLPYLIWAKKYGATVYMLEHRFYGESRVGDNTNFNRLSSLQMIYDIADFIRSVNIKSGTSNPWITFGGSYSGLISAWTREVFPELVVGAVASSAPVFAKTDFYEYLMVAENSIRSYNSTCADRIQEGFNSMRALFLTKGGRQTLSSMFKLDPPFADNVTDIDQHYFFSNIYSNFQGDVQYSGDNMGSYANSYGIPDMCKIMTNDSNTPLNNIVAFNEYMANFYNGGGPYFGLDNSYQDMINFLINAKDFGPDAEASLLWTWQTCSEFGYFQSADSGNGIFGSPTPVNFFIQICMDVFNNYYQRSAIDPMVDNTNYMYGERFHFRGSNVVFPNGNKDPWHALGLYYPTDSSVVSYLIDGTAHCADMYPARDADVPGLKVVRDLIDQNIAIWLNQAPPSTGTTQTSGTGSTASPGTGSTSQPVTATTVQATTKSTTSVTVLTPFIAMLVSYLL